jgi:hypothetical protein
MIDFNWDILFDTLQKQSIPDWDKELVGAAVVKAVELFYDKDQEYEVLGTEMRGDQPCPFLIDLVLHHSTYSNQDKYKLVDWKYKKSGKLDDRWAMRESRSWQPRIYAAAIATLYGADVFPIHYEIRGVAPMDDDAKHCEVRVIPMTFSRAEAVEAVRYIRGIVAMRDSLIQIGKNPWPKDPSGCRMYGDFYKCEYEPYCWEGIRLPEPNKDYQPKTLSHSSAADFLRCPEYHRLRTAVMGHREDDDGEAAAAGRAFHKVVETLWRGDASNNQEQNPNADKGIINHRQVSNSVPSKGLEETRGIQPVIASIADEESGSTPPSSIIYECKQQETNGGNETEVSSSKFLDGTTGSGPSSEDIENIGLSDLSQRKRESD